MTVDQDPDHDADRRFLDALLARHFAADPAQDAARVEVVLRRIDGARGRTESPVAGPGWLRSLRPLAPLAAAAAVLLAVLLVPTLFSNTASAAIQRASVAMARAIDLHYRVEIDSPLGIPLGGEVWTRGNEFVVLRLNTPAGELWAGEGRASAWIVPPLDELPVRLNDSGHLRDVLKIQDDMSAPLLHIGSTLERLGEWCELRFDPDGETIEARRVEGAPDDIPVRARIRIGPDGIVREFDAEWTPILGPRGCRLTWIGAPELADRFYEHDAHHDPGRAVVDLR
jgi:hypothetical protein